MKKLIFLILIISTNFVHSQKDPLDRYLTKIEHTDHNACVKSIFVEDSIFENRDYLSKRFKVIYNDKDQIKRYIMYGESLSTPFKIVIYDSLKRVEKIEINRKDGNGEKVVQYFRENLTEPDSIKIFTSDLLEIRKYDNHFKDDLLVRREIIENDTLRLYTLFEYDSNKNLTKELSINTKNGFGVINNLGNSTTKHLNPNDSTLFNYKKVGDTIIVEKERFKGLVVREKTYNDDNLDVKIEEQINKNKNFVFQRWVRIKTKDSIISEHTYYKNKGELKSYYNSYTYDDKKVSKWIDPNMMKDGKPEKKSITKIEKEFDHHGNWIKKTFKQNDTITSEISRTIEYYCDEIEQ